MTTVDDPALPATNVPRPRPSRLRPVAASVAAVGATNLAIYLVGRLGGASFTYSQGGVPTEVDAVAVLIMSIVPLAVGLAVTAGISRRWRPMLTIARIVVPVLAVLTIFTATIPAGFDRASTVLLAAMHLVVVPGAWRAIAVIATMAPAPTAAEA
jgi:hypothetical protein